MAKMAVTLADTMAIALALKGGRGLALGLGQALFVGGLDCAGVGLVGHVGVAGRTL
jgi:hypothetical protein